MKPHTENLLNKNRSKRQEKTKEALESLAIFWGIVVFFTIFHALIRMLLVWSQK